jgi:putative transposase
VKSIKIRLELNNKQKTLALQHCGTARYAYNWALSYCKKIDEFNKTAKKEDKQKYPSAIDFHKMFVKDVKSVNKWLYDVSKWTAQEPLRNLQKAYSRYFSELKQGVIQKKKNEYVAKRKAKGLFIDYDIVNDIGRPNFKKKGIKDSFYLEANITANKNKIKVPKFGWLKCSEILPNCEIKNVVISRTADEWFISFKIPHTSMITIKTKGVVGCDLGVKNLVTLSDGITFENLKPYRKAKRKLKLAQRKMSKKYVKGAKNQSSNYKKASLVVAKIHQDVANIRKDNLHKITTFMSKNYEEIVIEDLKISNMVKNHKLAGVILDGGLFEFRRQLEYKAKWYGCIITIADPYFPSSKLCSNCGNKKEVLKLSERTYNCKVCNFTLDRDENAAQNLKKLAVSLTVSTCGV